MALSKQDSSTGDKVACFIPVLLPVVTGCGLRITISAACLKCCVLRLQWKRDGPLTIGCWENCRVLLSVHARLNRDSGSPEKSSRPFFPVYKPRIQCPRIMPGERNGAQTNSASQPTSESDHERRSLTTHAKA